MLHTFTISAILPVAEAGSAELLENGSGFGLHIDRLTPDSAFRYPQTCEIIKAVSGLSGLFCDRPTQKPYIVAATMTIWVDRAGEQHAGLRLVASHTHAFGRTEKGSRKATTLQEFAEIVDAPTRPVSH